MISLRIKNTKTFMSHLLVKDTFDNFLLSEADIKTSCSHSIDGQINRAFYSDEEWETLEGDARRYELWLNQKPFCFSLIKGSKVPSSMKIVMLMSTKDTEALLSQIEAGLSTDNINGLFIISGIRRDTPTSLQELHSTYSALIRHLIRHLTLT